MEGARSHLLADKNFYYQKLSKQNDILGADKREDVENISSGNVIRLIDSFIEKMQGELDSRNLLQFNKRNQGRSFCNNQNTYWKLEKQSRK